MYDLYAFTGNGSYGGVKIWLSKYVPTNQYVAVKRIDLDHCKLSFSLLQVSRREVKTSFSYSFSRLARSAGSIRMSSN